MKQFDSSIIERWCDFKSYLIEYFNYYKGLQSYNTIRYIYYLGYRLSYYDVTVLFMFHKQSIENDVFIDDDQWYRIKSAIMIDYQNCHKHDDVSNFIYTLLMKMDKLDKSYSFSNTLNDRYSISRYNRVD